MKIPLLCISLALVSGCILPSVPTTKIAFNPQTDSLNVSSPKDVTIDSVTISKSKTNFTMTVTGYKSTNNAALVGVVSQAQAQVASNAAVTINNLATLGMQAVSKVP